MEDNKAVFFVSVIRPLNKNVTSTYIMTSTLLKGIKENNKKVIFFAICEHDDELNLVKEYFSDYVDLVVPLHSSFGYDLSKYNMLKKLIFRSLFIGFYRKEIKKHLCNMQFKPELIISHSPSFESICYSQILKKHFTDVIYLQYWSDPMALSGITPDKIDYKRIPFKIIESMALTKADKIIYGTKTLMFFQKKLYPKIAHKMAYIDIPYVEKTANKQEVVPHSILYAGNYYKNIRNIEPLVDAIESMDGYTLDLYGEGELEKIDLEHTVVHGRISAEELNKLEGKYEYLVCILNHSCIQIPGKIFYDMARNVKILVIADGKYKDLICKYLSEYDRYIVCENDSKAIRKNILENIKNIDLSRIEQLYSPKSVCSFLLQGGK